MSAKRIFSVLLTFVLVISALAVFPFSAAAETTEYVAQIGDKGYATLADAVKAVPKGAPETTIELLSDVKISNIMVGHQYPQTIVIDLNGHTISSSNRTLTAYRKGTTLTLKNGTVSGNATTGSVAATYNSALVLGEDLTVSCAGGSAIAIYVDNGTLTINEASVKAVNGATSIKASSNVNNKIEISAGTFKTAPDQAWCKSGYSPVKNEDGTYTVKLTAVAKSGDTYYNSLAEAVEKAADKATITVLKNISVDKDDVVTLDGKYSTFFKVEGKTLTIDLNGKTISGDAEGISGMLVGLFSTDNKGHLTLKDSAGKGAAKVESNDAKVYALIVNYEPDCSITIEGGSYSLDKASDSLMYTGANEGLVVKGGTFVLGNVGTGKNESPWIVNALGQNTAHAIITGGTFNADVQHQYYPFEIEVPKEYALKQSGENYTVIPAAAYIEEKISSGGTVYTNYIGCETLTKAIDKAADGTTVTLVNNVSVDKDDAVKLDGKYSTFFKIEGKTITVNLNGKTISGNAAGISDMLVGLFSTDNEGHLTLKDSAGKGAAKVASNGAKVYALIVNYEKGCTITIEGGSYSLDKASDCLMYTGANEGLVVKGGTFNLGNIGTGKNQSPWMFNALGQNTAHAVVKGGTFNADVQHQYYPFEVEVPKELALKKNNGTFTIVDAVAYVNEQEFSGKWYTNNIGYATIEEAEAAVEAPKTSWDGKVSAQEYVTVIEK